jgi:hypothetical protein
MTRRYEQGLPFGSIPALHFLATPRRSSGLGFDCAGLKMARMDAGRTQANPSIVACSRRSEACPLKNDTPKSMTKLLAIKFDFENM